MYVGHDTAEQFSVATQRVILRLIIFANPTKVEPSARLPLIQPRSVAATRIALIADNGGRRSSLDSAACTDLKYEQTKDIKML